MSSLLNELDTDLLLELDEKVKDIQRQTLTNVRSAVAMAKLLERLPDLPLAIDRDKQARIDSIMMQAKHFEGDSRISTSVKTGSVDELQLPSLAASSRRKSSKALRSAITPEMEGRVPPSDMLFEMEDEVMLPEALTKESTGPRGKVFSGDDRRISSSLLKPYQEIWYDSKGKPMSSSQDVGISSLSPDLSPVVPGTAPTTQPLRPPDLKAQGAPWGPTPLPSSKLDLKEIMAQASASRTSNISLGFSSQSKQSQHERAPAQHPLKVSQRNRKKMQLPQPSSEPPLTDVETPLPEAKGPTPWQRATPHSKIALKDVIGEESKTTPTTDDTLSTSRNSSAPQLTMRQTVANPTAIAGSPKDSRKQTSQPPLQQRSISSPQAPGGHSSNSSTPRQIPKGISSGSSPIPAPGTFSSSPSVPPPAIRSISHLQNPLSSTARAAEPSLGLSMAEIVLQQQAEKDIIHEVSVAKRSLQDIQQEQEFQEWWDKESRKVQGIVEEEKDEEQEAGREGSTTRGSARGKGGRGRGRGGRGGWKAKRGESSTADGKEKAEGSEAMVQKGGERGRRSRRGRGSSER